MATVHRGAPPALRPVCLAVVVVLTVTAPCPAAVDLVLRAQSSRVSVGNEVRIDLFAVSDDGSEQEFSGLDVILIWDAAALRLVGFEDAPLEDRFLTGFPKDDQLDGLNADCGPDVFCPTYTGLPINDGDALYQSVWGPLPPFPSATEEGVRIVTFRFLAWRPTSLAVVGIGDAVGEHAMTGVFAPGVGEVTGLLIGTGVKVTGPKLVVPDVHVPAGRQAEVWVLGETNDHSAFGVTIVLEISALPDASGAVAFTPAPPSDIAQLSDPWPGVGGFTPFDTDLTESSQLNGAVADNGTFVAAPVTFSGPLGAFPIAAESAAAGRWKVSLTLSDDPVEPTRSVWNWLVMGEQPHSDLRDGNVVIVDPGDGDGNADRSLRDFSELQNCFTGFFGPGPPVYDTNPALRCVVYDMDGDGDVDDDDYAEWNAGMALPVP